MARTCNTILRNRLACRSCDTRSTYAAPHERQASFVPWLRSSMQPICVRSLRSCLPLSDLGGIWGGLRVSERLGESPRDSHKQRFLLQTLTALLARINSAQNVFRSAFIRRENV